MPLTRRDVLYSSALAAAALAARPFDATAQSTPAPRPTAPSDTTRFFPGFKSFTVQTSGAMIHGVVGGSGPPILLLHGAPQSHISWRLVAPKLAATRTVVVPDLRGYGDSSKPADGDNHVNYSKRAMALDQVEVMRALAHERFAVVGHERGGRQAHRTCLQHPERGTRPPILNIVPRPYS